MHNLHNEEDETPAVFAHLQAQAGVRHTFPFWQNIIAGLEQHGKQKISIGIKVQNDSSGNNLIHTLISHRYTDADEFPDAWFWSLLVFQRDQWH